MPRQPKLGRAKNDNERLPINPANKPKNETPPDKPLLIGFPVKTLQTVPLLNMPISEEKVSAAAAEKTANESNNR